MASGIASVASEALDSFNRLLETIPTFDNQFSRHRLFLKLQDDLARFKIWAGNSAAHRTGRASLDHRLRDASHIRQEVLGLLTDLKESLKDSIDILTGTKTPWNEHGDEDEDETLDQLETATEIDQISQDITELVDCLFRLSVSIQNPAPHDTFMAAKSTDTSAYEPFDIQHVQTKFQYIEKFLARRLGRAISRRRQYFKYREAHHQKLSYGLEHHGDTNKTEIVPTTLASSIPQHMKDGADFVISAEDTGSDTDASQTSFATSAGSSKTLRVPPLPKEALSGPFRCPFCYLIVSVQNSRGWKKHIFDDLKPYNCVVELCTASDQEFCRRNAWMQHMLEHHLRAYCCPCGCSDPFSSATELRRHLVKEHTANFPESEIQSIIQMSSRPLAQDAHTICPFCSVELSSLRSYRHHVGNHQQELALFALPKLDQPEESSEKGGSISDPYTDDDQDSDETDDVYNSTTQEPWDSTFPTAVDVSRLSPSAWSTNAVDEPTDLNVSTCNTCKREFGNARQLRRHHKEVHREADDPRYICKCSYSATRKSNYIRHLTKSCRKKHDPDLVFVCSCREPSNNFDVHFEHIKDCGRQQSVRRPNAARRV